MNRIVVFCLSLICAWVGSTAAFAEMRVIDRPGIVFWFDCELGGPVATYYRPGPDTGDIKRGEYYLEDDWGDCKQQKSSDPYKTEDDEPNFARGHIVAINHLDGNADWVKTSDGMINLLPQLTKFNGAGAWPKTERLIECWRDHKDIEIWTGVVWTGDDTNDFFVESHGIVTPDAYIKLVRNRDNGAAIAWDLQHKEVDKDLLHTLILPPDEAAALIEQLVGSDFIPEMPNSTDLNEWVPDSCYQH